MAKYEVKLPKLGESIVSATIVSWYKHEGDLVELDESLVEVATDKVNSEIPSPSKGKLIEIVATEGKEVSVGDVIAYLETDEAFADVEQKVEESSIKPELSNENEGKNSFYSPAVLRLAKENGISFEELNTIKGSGENGRVTKKDVLAHQKISEKKQEPLEDGDTFIPLSQVRKATAKNMVASYTQVPHATLIEEIDVTEIQKFLKTHKSSFFEKYQAKLSITTFMAYAIIKAAKNHPYVNSCFSNEGILLKKKINLGIAVSVNEGVLVPVIQNSNQMTLSDIAKSIYQFALKAKEEKLSLADTRGGTITLSNFGLMGTWIGFPIIKQPESAILAMGGIKKRVEINQEGEVEARDKIVLTLTFDHRVFDGMYGCSFLKEIKDTLEKVDTDEIII
ncbi:MAG TPA: dihydrolipoamide acetyltransferase family protein [Chlamydiales bacterium]|nr:dihydrolipoamide acetyltransferase family protein [Chlamydiales bacterium]